MTSRAVSLLSSWWTTAALCMTLCALYVSASFGDAPYTAWVNTLFQTPAGLLVTAFFALNISFASVRVVRQRLSARAVGRGLILSMDSSLEVPLQNTASLQTVSAWMASKGMPPVLGDNKAIWQSGRYSFMAGTIFRAGLIVLIISTALSLQIRKSNEAVIHNHSEEELLGVKLKVSSITSGLPEEFLHVGEEGAFKLDQVSAKVVIDGAEHVLDTGFPVMINGLYYRITDIGFSEEVSISSGRDSLNKRLALNVLPPGKTDTVKTLSGSLPVSFGLKPEKTIKRGILTGRLYNLKSPRYLVSFNGRDGKRHELSAFEGQELSAGGVSLSVGRHDLSVKVMAVRDPALPFIYTGFILVLAGATLMLTRLFWYEKKMVVMIDGNALLIGYSEEFYKKWGMMKFEKWKEEWLSDQS